MHYSRQDKGSRTIFTELAVHTGRAAALPCDGVAGASVLALANTGTASAIRPGGASCGESREDEWAKKSFLFARNEAK